jgi:hypothetical protein
MTSTDKTIEIQCSECSAIETGLDTMVHHILEAHHQYGFLEAQVYAQEWMQEAYAKEEEHLADYYKQRKEDPSV